MEKRTQLQYLKRKYRELSRQYLDLLRTGDSLQQIKDFSYVLDCLRSEINMLDRDLRPIPAHSAGSAYRVRQECARGAPG